MIMKGYPVSVVRGFVTMESLYEVAGTSMRLQAIGLRKRISIII